MVNNPLLHKLDEKEHQSIFEKDIKPDIFANTKPSSQPIAIIFGGQPGAGKSAAIDIAISELDMLGGFVQIIGDDLRNYHPKYAKLMEADDRTAAFYTDRDTGRWVEKTIAEAKNRRVNIVIEGTMRDSGKVVETMLSLRAAGYTIDARVLAVHERLSEQGIFQRYEHQKADRGVGRMTTPEAHRAAYEAVPATLERIEREKLADRVTLYRRGGEEIYRNELQNGQWQQAPQARQALEVERARIMTPEEAYQYTAGWGGLLQQLEEPTRKATGQEKIAIRERYDAAIQQATQISPYVGKLLSARSEAVKRLAGEKLSLQDMATVMRQFDKRAAIDLQTETSRCSVPFCRDDLDR